MGSATAAAQEAPVAAVAHPRRAVPNSRLLEWKLLASSTKGRRSDDDDDENQPSKITPTSTSSTATVAAARCAVEAYTRLPPRGKPNDGEHTVMASFVIEEVEEEEEKPQASTLPSNASSSSSSPFFNAVAVATGSKCVGGGARTNRGDVVNDCHAEVLARRAFLRWMVAEMEKAKKGKGEGAAAGGSRFFERGDDSKSSSSSSLPRFRKRTQWRLHLVTTQVPCGDACVRPGAVTGARAMVTMTRRKGGGGEEEEEEESAKNLCPPPPLLQPPPPPPPPRPPPEGGFIDVKDQRPGIARRKPGRGDSTLSMSCSDKIAKWGCLGVQGALLSRVLASSSGDGGEKEEGGALFIDEVTVVVAAEEGNTDEEEQVEGSLRTVSSLQRALADRTWPLRACLESPFRWCPPRRLSVVAVAWAKEEGEKEEEMVEGGGSHPLSFCSRNPLDDLGLDTSAAAAAAAGKREDGTGEEEKLFLSARRTPSGLALAWSAVKERNGSGNYERAEVLLGGYGCLAGVNRKQEGKEKKRKKAEEEGGRGEEAEARKEEKERRPHRPPPPPLPPPLPQLSKRAAFARFLELVGEGSSARSEPSKLLASSTYREAKEGAAAYRRSWARMLLGPRAAGAEEATATTEPATAATEPAARYLASSPPPPPPLQGWLAKPAELEAFSLSLE